MVLERLRSSRDIRTVFAARDVRHGEVAAVHAVSRGDQGPARATVVAGRKLGGAVVRNRAKRRLRAALSEIAVPPGTDVVVVARPASVRTTYGALVAELTRLVEGRRP